MLHPRSLHPAHFCRCPDSLRSVQYPQGARAVAEDGIHRAAATNAQLERLRKAVQSNAAHSEHRGHVYRRDDATRVLT